MLYAAPPDVGPPICEGAEPLPPLEDRFPKIESSPFHSCALLSGGQVACWGQNLHRELGDGTWETRSRPTLIESIYGLSDLSVFPDGTCAARRDGAVFCWGSPWGPLPTVVYGLENITRVSAYGGTACGVRNDGAVVCAGAADGDGYERTKVGPQEIAGVRDAVDVAVGSTGICVLHRCGRVSCGSRYWKPDDKQPKVRAIAPLVPVGGLDNATMIAMAGSVSSNVYDRACALRTDGRVRCFPPTSGVASAPDALPDDEPFAGIGGGQGICAFTARGRALCFGPSILVREKAEDPEVADEVTLLGIQAVSHGGAFRCGASGPVEISCWGRTLGGDTGETVVPVRLGKLDDITQISAGGQHTCVTRKSGEHACFGPVQSVTLGGDDGSGGFSHNFGAPWPGMHFVAEVKVGDLFTCFRTRRGEVFCGGRDEHGQLGDGAHKVDEQLPLRIEGLVDATSLVAGRHYACAVRASGEVACWGRHPLSSHFGLRPAVVPALSGVVELAAGDEHACGRTATGRILCIGNAPSFGQKASAEIVQIVAGRAHTCVRFRSGHVACAGAADPAPYELPEPAIHIAAGGDETCAVMSSGHVSCWGGGGRWASPWRHVEKAKEVATSGKHACALLQNGEAVCWGDSRHGKLSDGAYEARHPPTGLPILGLQ